MAEQHTTKQTQVLDLRGVDTKTPRPGQEWPDVPGEEAYWELDPTSAAPATTPAATTPAATTPAVVHPVERGLAGPVGALFAFLFSAAVAGLDASLPSMPLGSSRGWGIVWSMLDVDGYRTVSTWWGTVLFALTAVWCWAAARRARGLRRWGRWLCWNWVSVAMLAMSASHLLALHTQLSNLESIRNLGLPNVVSSHPVEFALLAFLAVPGVALMLNGRNRQRVQLAAGALCFVLGSYVIGSGMVTVSTNGQYQHVAEVALEWTGLCLVMLAAAAERTVSD